MRESFTVNRETKYCSGLIHQTKGEILNQVQNDNWSETGTEVPTPIDVASSFNWTEEKVRPSKDGFYKPNRPERQDSVIIRVFLCVFSQNRG